MKPTAIALLSGGLDSLVAVALAAKERPIARAITFDYGQRAADPEIAAAERFCRLRGIAHETIELPWLGGATTTALVNRAAALPRCQPEELCSGEEARAGAVWVPNRNGLFVAIAAALAEGGGHRAIVAGFNAEEAAAFPDNSAAFVEATNAALACSTQAGVVLIAPTLTMQKAEIARRFLALDLDPAGFWCCYDGGEKLCGNCESCARTIRAFRGAGAWDLIRERFA